MSSMPESIWLHKYEKYNTGDSGIWYDADFSEKVKNEGIENYVEYVPKYRMDEAIIKLMKIEAANLAALYQCGRDPKLVVDSILENASLKIHEEARTELIDYLRTLN